MNLWSEVGTIKACEGASGTFSVGGGLGVADPLWPVVLSGVPWEILANLSFNNSFHPQSYHEQSKEFLVTVLLC